MYNGGISKLTWGRLLRGLLGVGDGEVGERLHHLLVLPPRHTDLEWRDDAAVNLKKKQVQWCGSCVSDSL